MTLKTLVVLKCRCCYAVLQRTKFEWEGASVIGYICPGLQCSFKLAVLTGGKR
jgi:hypothetical protein